MTNLRWPWWMAVAAVYAVVVPLLALGNLAGGDSGPLSGKLLGVAAAMVMGGAIASGVRLRLAGRRRLGSGLMALGVLPASALIVFLWFPPVAALGVLALVVTVKAAADAFESRPDPVASGTT